jgi:catechol 2,3-dioxygenase-like lactoylglutathione lyase family enzyme
VLGLRLIMSAGTFALFDAGSGRLALKAGEPAPGGVLLALEVDDLAGWVARLGARVEGPVKDSEEGYRRARLHDPDGYEIALFEWTEETLG